MTVIRSAHAAPRKRRPHVALRLLNIAFSIIVSSAFWGLAGYAILRSRDGGWPERLSTIFIAVSGGLSGALLINQSLKDANPASLALILPKAAAFTFAVDYLGNQVFISSPQLSRLRQSEVIDFAMFFGAAYLLIWERGARTDAGGDDIIDTLRSVGAVWPMFLVIAALVVLEYLLW